MDRYILFVTLIILSIVGISEVCRKIIIHMTNAKIDYIAFLIIPIRGRCTNAEQILRAAAQRQKCIPSKSEKQIICLDCGMDEETKSICQLVCKDYEFIKIYNKEMLRVELEKT